MAGKTRSTALKIIGGLAIEAYRINIHAERLESLPEMVRDLEHAEGGGYGKDLEGMAQEAAAANVIEPMDSRHQNPQKTLKNQR